MCVFYLLLLLLEGGSQEVVFGDPCCVVLDEVVLVFFCSTPIPVLTPLTPPEQAALRLEPPHDVAEPFDETSS